VVFLFVVIDDVTRVDEEIRVMGEHVLVAPMTFFRIVDSFVPLAGDDDSADRCGSVREWRGFELRLDSITKLVFQRESSGFELVVGIGF